MSNLDPSVVPLQSGLDLQSPKLLAQPGSMLDCLNYEIIDQLGYSRIAGFLRYDGNITYGDIPSIVMYSSVLSPYTGPTTSFSNTPFEDADGNEVGFIFSFSGNDFTNTATIKYISFLGDILPAGSVPSESLTWSSGNLEFPQATQITQDQLNALSSYLLGLVTAPDYTPIGLHWFLDTLYAVVPLVMAKYEAVATNEIVSYIINDTVTSTDGSTGILLDKIVTTAAAVGVAETGYLILKSTTGDWIPDGPDDTDTLSGAVSAASGVYHQTGRLVGMDSMAARMWKATRSGVLLGEPGLSTPGWNALDNDTFTLTVTLSGVTTPLNTLRSNDTLALSTYYFSSGGGNVLSATVYDYFIVSGSFAAGDAVLRLQVGDITLSAGAADLDITTSFDMYSDSGAVTKLADVTVRMSYNYLPGLPSLTEASSRYEFKTANFYAADGMDAVYGVSGASRAFIFDGEAYTFVYTQDDSTKDKPRHVEVHHLHLALGYAAGSVLMSVVGEPYDFNGVNGASEIAVGDRITGLMELEGTTLGVFCEQSIWAIVGTSVDNFQTQVISPNTGCIEYTLANCGFPVYLDSRGISTLETSARYGDFVGQRLSSPVSPWLVPRCRGALPNINNASGVTVAVPVRSKNQYRLFFNDGEILTTTFVVQGDGGTGVGFTFQRYYLEQPDITTETYRFIPIAATSQVDVEGVERIFMSHYNSESPIISQHVYAMDQGDSFDGKYIPHSFDTNWYFGDSPTMYRGIQKVRVHGLSHGYSLIDVYAASIDNDYGFGTNIFQTTPEPINLPRTAGNIYNDLLPVTNICNLANRGLGIQLRFKGRNTDLTKPEPGHIMQVMVIYSRPSGGPDA